MHVQEKQQVLDVFAVGEQIENSRDRRDDRNEYQHHHGDVVARTLARMTCCPPRARRRPRPSAAADARGHPVDEVAAPLTALDGDVNPFVPSAAVAAVGSRAAPGSRRRRRDVVGPIPPLRRAWFGGFIERTSENATKNTRLITTYMRNGGVKLARCPSRYELVMRPGFNASVTRLRQSRESKL